MSSTDKSMYLVLPSNVNNHNFKNTNSNYKIRLTDRLSLNSGKWQIALVDCHYVNNWDNVTEGEITVRQTYDDVVNTDGVPTAEDQLAMSTVYNCNVRTGRYENITGLVQEISNSLKKSNMDDHISVMHDRVRDIFFLIFHDDNHSIKFGPDIAAIFGFSPNQYYSRLSPSMNFHAGATKPDVNQGSTMLYVYCNLCNNRCVGDASVPLLRVLPIRYNRKNDSKNVYEEVRLPHYVPVATTDTDVVEIDIRGDDGKPVLFKGGKVCVTVHLRQIT